MRCVPIAALLLAGALGAALPRPVAAADAPATGVEAQLEEFRSLVGAGRYLRALEELRFLARQVQEMRLRDVGTLFPPSPEGWTAGEIVALSGPEEVWSRRLAARREYRRGDDGPVVEVTLDFHAPDLAAAALAFNPLFVVGDPRVRILEIGAQKARASHNPDTAEGEVRLVLGGEVLVTVRGRRIASDAPLVDFAGRLDFPAVLARARR